MVHEAVDQSRGTGKHQYILMLLVIVAMTVLVTVYRTELLKLGQWGYRE